MSGQIDQRHAAKTIAGFLRQAVSCSATAPSAHAGTCARYQERTPVGPVTHTPSSLTHSHAPWHALVNSSSCIFYKHISISPSHAPFNEPTNFRHLPLRMMDRGRLVYPFVGHPQRQKNPQKNEKQWSAHRHPRHRHHHRHHHHHHHHHHHRHHHLPRHRWKKKRLKAEPTSSITPLHRRITK